MGRTWPAVPFKRRCYASRQLRAEKISTTTATSKTRAKAGSLERIWLKAGGSDGPPTPCKPWATLDARERQGAKAQASIPAARPLRLQISAPRRLQHWRATSQTPLLASGAEHLGDETWRARHPFSGRSAARRRTQHGQGSGRLVGSTSCVSLIGHASTLAPALQGSGQSNRPAPFTPTRSFKPALTYRFHYASERSP